MKRSILVLGIERTGTRIVTKMIIDGGVWGDSNHEQRVNMALIGKYLIPDEIETVVIRRSYPHNGLYPSINRLIYSMNTIGYPISDIVLTIRDTNFVIISQHKSDKILPFPAEIKDRDREKLFQKSLKIIFEQLSKIKIPVTVISYEALVNYPQFIFNHIKDRLNLPKLPNTEIFDGNKKYTKKR